MVPVGDEAPVLHGPAEFGQGNHVQFGQRKVNAEIVFVELEDSWTDIEAVIGLIDSRMSGPDTERNATTFHFRLDVGIVGHHHSHQVRRHGHRRLEPVPFIAVHSVTATTSSRH